MSNDLGLPKLHIVIPLEGKARQYIEASHEGDEQRLRDYLENSPLVRNAVAAASQMWADEQTEPGSGTFKF
jgi:uncharacterized protein YhdP